MKYCMLSPLSCEYRSPLNWEAQEIKARLGEKRPYGTTNVTLVQVTHCSLFRISQCSYLTLSFGTDWPEQTLSDTAFCGIWFGSTLFATHQSGFQTRQLTVKLTCSNFRTTTEMSWGLLILRVNKALFGPIETIQVGIRKPIWALATVCMIPV